MQNNLRVLYNNTLLSVPLMHKGIYHPDRGFEIAAKFEAMFCEAMSSEMNQRYAQARKIVEGE